MPPALQSEPVIENRRDEFILSTDRERLDIDVIHGFLSESYWASGIAREIVARSIENLLCFGIYQAGQQIGFARAPKWPQISMELCNPDIYKREVLK